VRAVDKSRLIKKLGSIDEKTQVALCNTLQELFTY
jgi:mRNA interferase MazF